MNWKLLSITLLGLSLVACEGKKEEKKAEDATAPAAEGFYPRRGR